MSEISQLVQMVTALTNRLNAIENNGKKIDELNPLEILNPSARLHVSIDGLSKRIDIAQLIEAISNANHDQIVSISGSISVDGNVVTVPPLVWLLENILYQTLSDTDITIPYCATGLNRKDIFVLNNSNEVLRIAGPEDADIVIRPNVPIGTLFLTDIDVSDSAIGTPTDPVIGTQFVKKIEFSEINIPDSSDIRIELNSESTAFVLTGEVTSLIGFEMSDDFVSTNLFIGKEIKLVNKTGSDFPILHNGAATYPARFPLETDFVWKNNEVAIFKPVKRDVLFLEFVSNSRDEVVDLSTKADLVGGKVPVEQLPSYVDDVIEVANYAALPGTGETSKIYITTDNNSQYRWSGSVYVQISLDAREQIEIGSSTNVSNNWHGKVVLFTASCTITVPSSLIANFAFEWVTLAGVTITWAITSPKTWLFGAPAATAEKKTGAFMQRGSTNSIILLT